MVLKNNFIEGKHFTRLYQKTGAADFNEVWDIDSLNNKATNTVVMRVIRAKNDDSSHVGVQTSTIELTKLITLGWVLLASTNFSCYACN